MQEIAKKPCPRCGEPMHEVPPTVQGQTWHCDRCDFDICEHMINATKKDVSNFHCMDCETPSIEECDCHDCSGGVWCDKCKGIVRIPCYGVLEIMRANEEKNAMNAKLPKYLDATQSTLKPESPLIRWTSPNKLVTIAQRTKDFTDVIITCGCCKKQKTINIATDRIPEYKEFAQKGTPLCRQCGKFRKNAQTNAEKTIDTVYNNLKDLKEKMMADCGQGKSYEAGAYSTAVDAIMKKIEDSKVASATIDFEETKEGRPQ